MSMRISPEEVVSRKEYLKKKNRERKIRRLKGMSTSTRVIICFVIVISVYVAYQFSIYNKKHRLIQTLPDEISSLKDFYIYYVSDGYTYDKQNSLKYMSAMSDEKTNIEKGKGISKISISNKSVYGIKNGALVKVDTDGKLTTLIEKNVQRFAVYKGKVYALLKGEGIETGIYTLNKRKEEVKVIDGDYGQILVNEDNIYLLNNERHIVSYDKDGKNQQNIMMDAEASYMILNGENIIFVNKSDGDKIYKVNVKDKKVLKLTNHSAGVADGGEFAYSNGEQYIGASEEYVYYINSSDENNLYKVKNDGTEEAKLLKGKVQILDTVEDTIFYKIEGDIGVYRFDATARVSSQVTSARVLEFKVSEKE